MAAWARWPTVIVELGHFALILALVVSVMQASLPLVGAHYGNARLMGLAHKAALVLLGLIALSFLALTWAHVVSDFSVVNVVENSHSAKPLLYKITGVWGNHEGSMLLWVLILALFGALVALFAGDMPQALKARTLAVQGLIAAGFLAFTLFASNPFLRRFPAPANGADLNPLLQDPGLAFHPPLLYGGYVGFSIVFSFAVAALIEGRVTPAWAAWVRPWVLTAWICLTAGIALGAWWAYYELGWGGWWFWDPVENVSFMPWLIGTALLHSIAVVERRDALKVWTVLLAVLAFSLSLVGTFIVRSGLLSSVHAFAVDPERGFFILVLLGLAVGSAFTLFAWRAPAMKPGGYFQPISREGALVFNNLFLGAAAATVFVGTLYPLFLEAYNGNRVSIGPPFYNKTFVPLMVPLIALMAVGPLLAWKRADLKKVLQKLLPAAGVLLTVLIAAYLIKGGPLVAVMAIGLAGWLAAATLGDLARRIALFQGPLQTSWRRLVGLRRRTLGMTLAHFGLAVAMAGMAASAAWKAELSDNLLPGESFSQGGYEITLREVAVDQTGPNYLYTRALIEVREDGDLVASLRPERRFYPVQAMPTTEAAIVGDPLGDFYGIIGERAQSGAWTVRVLREPLVPWLWTGALLLVVGGLMSVSDRKPKVTA